MAGGDVKPATLTGLQGRRENQEGRGRTTHQEDKIENMIISELECLPGSRALNEISIRCGRCHKTKTVPMARGPIVRIHYFKHSKY